MSIFRRPLTQRKPLYRVLIVKPIGDFKPTNWQQKPSQHAPDALANIADTTSLGKADAFRFRYNQLQKTNGAKTWAILTTVSNC
jgi:hypothetical protein